jgi:5-oxoprolinase (ATP-hydrolysing) subunit A
MPTIDLNCDLGEHPESIRAGVDAALMSLVTSANIACGGHAGDEQTMDAMVLEAQRTGCAVGAHPGYPDRANFGRLAVRLSPREIEATVATQLSALRTVASRRGVEIAHLKPHGALYHAAMHEAPVAHAIGQAALATGRVLMVGQSGAPALAVWQAMGLPVLAEAFADRRYEPDGSLRARATPGALITDPADAAAQALRIARGEPIDADGTPLRIAADTICIHSDTPGALDVARAVRDTLLAHGITAHAPSGS